MSARRRSCTLVAAALAGCSIALAGRPQAPADPRQTVCTVTVNSADEKESFERALPAARFRFVELVQPGRSDWLQAACRAAVRKLDYLCNLWGSEGVTRTLRDGLVSAMDRCTPRPLPKPEE